MAKEERLMKLLLRINEEIDRLDGFGNKVQPLVRLKKEILEMYFNDFQ